MKRTVGSSAQAQCPNCGSHEAKVALTTETLVFYRCTNCQHAWPTREDTPMERGGEVTGKLPNARA